MSRMDQAKIRNVSRNQIAAFLQKHFPNGKLQRDIFTMGNVAGDKGESLCFSLDTCLWKDFAIPNQKGGTLVDLIMANKQIRYPEALKLISKDLSLENTAAPAKHRNAATTALIPIPEDAPFPPVSLGDTLAGSPGYFLRKIYTYRDAQGRTMLYVHRYENVQKKTGKGKPAKRVQPYTFRRPGGWSHKGPGLPLSPLYGLDQLTARSEAHVLLVEGEKAADKTVELFPNYVAVSWLGGLGQLGKADFSPLKDRIVIYWPDADEPGQKSVEAIAKKAREVAVRDFKVVSIPTNLPTGWDVADEPPPGLDLHGLVQAAGPPPVTFDVLLRDVDINGLLERLVFNIGTEQFFDLISGYRAQSTQVNALFRHRQRGIASMLLENERMRKVQRLGYFPGNENRIVEEKDGLQALNLWRPSGLIRRAGDAAPFVQHLRYLCCGDEEFEHLANMLAFMIQKLGEKLMSAIVLVGPQGTGKSFVGHVMREILGTHNTAEVTSTQIKSDFNQFMEAKLLVIVEEIMTLGRIEVMNNLKPFITQPTVTINAKHLRPYTIENRANFLFLTNHEDALKLEDQDRRYFVVMSDSRPLPQKYYSDLWAWEKDNRGVILDWLLSRDLSQFNPNDRPPVTEGKRRMVEASRDDTEVLVAELIEGRFPPFDNDLVELKSAHHTILGNSSGTNPSRPMVMRALRANGAIDLRQKKGIVGGLEIRKSLWAIRNVDNYLKMSAQSIIDRFINQGRVPAGRAAATEPDMKF